jgi:hypothetical protein
MPGSWEEKFKEAYTSLFIESVKTMKDPKMKLTAEISAQMARDRYENWDVLLQRWATILKNSEDYEISASSCMHTCNEYNIETCIAHQMHQCHPCTYIQ